MTGTGQGDPSRRDLKVSVYPYSATANHFITQFTDVFTSRNISVSEFKWNIPTLLSSDVIILHWPDDFFRRHAFLKSLKLIAKTAMLRLAQIFGKAQLVWVAHNVKPHGEGRVGRVVFRCFARSLRGIIFLSDNSRELVYNEYANLRTVPAVATKHGHYRSVAQTPETIRTSPTNDPPAIVFFGLIRPYKNVEGLIAASKGAAEPHHLTIAGQVMDQDLGARITHAAELEDNVTLMLRDVPFSDSEMETIIDSADAIVLPYLNTLNSGVALQALSRNRPVFAPRKGSLVELQADLGEDWIYLYDGSLDASKLDSLVTSLKSHSGRQEVDLSTFGWDVVGGEIVRFLKDITGRTQR